MADEAIVLTHPGQISDEVSDHLVDYLEENREKDVFYIPGLAPERDQLVHLPEGYFSGLYDEVIEKQDLGYLYDSEAEDLVENYSRIEVGGYHKDNCVPNTLQSLERVDGSAEIETIDEIQFPLEGEEQRYKPKVTPLGQ